MNSSSTPSNEENSKSPEKQKQGSPSPSESTKKQSDSQRYAKQAPPPPVPPVPPELLQALPQPQGQFNGALVVGLPTAPKLLLSVDSIGVEWGKRPVPDEIFDLPDDERCAMAESYSTELPSLLISTAGGRLRVYPPKTFVQGIKGRDLTPLLIALATHQVDYLPWEAVDATTHDNFALVHERKR